MEWEKTPPGYVITTAKITRAGPVEYYGHELGMPGANAGKKFTINRTLEELSRPETLASFEGQTLTLTHPDNGEVDASEWKNKATGHIQNVRIEGDYIVCDVYIKDAAAIRVITDTGIRELSVGYEPAVIVERGGMFYQINIRCNHVAVVAEGRIGADCRLNDKKGGPMKFTTKDVIGLLESQRLNDAQGQPLTEEELTGMVTALESTLAALKSQLEATKGTASPPADADPESAADDSETKMAGLKSENENLKAKVAELEAEIEKLKADKETESTLTDARVRFPKVKFSDAKSARDVRGEVLKFTGVFTGAQVNGMSDSEIRAAYAAVQATSKPRSNIGDILLNDTTSKKPNLTRQFGGK